MGTDRRSLAWMPAEGRPEMTARLIMRGLRCGSRLMVTRLPLGRLAPKAAPILAANSGVRSTLTTPVTPNRPKSTRRPRAPQMMLVLTVAPGSISFSGQTLTLAWRTAPSPTMELSPTTTPSKSTALLLMVHCRPMMAPRTSAPSPM